MDTLIVNGAECEPYITSDHRMMLDHSDLVADGMYMMKQFIGCKKCVICIESNKADAIALLREKFAGDDSMEVRELNTVYPQGAKQVLLYNVTGKVTMQGQRMANLGVLIINVSSLAKVAYYIRTGMPSWKKLAPRLNPARFSSAVLCWAVPWVLWKTPS